nr:hypothetical protein [Tanacetum cinerariifolium]
GRSGSSGSGRKGNSSSGRSSQLKVLSRRSLSSHPCSPWGPYIGQGSIRGLGERTHYTQTTSEENHCSKSTTRRKYRWSLSCLSENRNLRHRRTKGKVFTSQNLDVVVNLLNINTALMKTRRDCITVKWNKEESYLPRKLYFTTYYWKGRSGSSGNISSGSGRKGNSSSGRSSQLKVLSRRSLSSHPCSPWGPYIGQGSIRGLGERTHYTQTTSEENHCSKSTTRRKYRWSLSCLSENRNLRHRRTKGKVFTSQNLDVVVNLLNINTALMKTRRSVIGIRTHTIEDIVDVS